MIAIVMPQVGQDIPAGRIAQWLKQVGEPVAKGEVVLVVESEKASFEIEADESGVLLEILHVADEEVEILEPVGYIGQPGETVERAEKTDKPAQAEAPPVEKPAQAAPARGDEVATSPAARRLADELGVDLAGVTAADGGRISKADVQAAAEAGQGGTVAAAPAGGDTAIPFSKMRRRIADRLTLSKQTIPHFYLTVDVDMTDAMEWVARFNADHGTHVTVTDMIVKAVARSLRSYPKLNAHVSADGINVKADVNVGIAVAVDDGLLVPVIGQADTRSLTEVSTVAKKNADDARRGMVNPEPIGTFTVTSLGMYGVRQFAAMINPPECAILAIGSAEPRVVPVQGGIGVRRMMTVTLACDHRAADGADAAGLLNGIREMLESPADALGDNQ